MRFQPVVVDLSDFVYDGEPIDIQEASKYDDAGYTVKFSDMKPSALVPEPELEIIPLIEPSGVQNG